jgi:branched-chain amino acid transport system permease protein
MLYREAGQYKTSYQADHAIFPLLQDRIGVAVILAVAAVMPFVASEFVVNSMLIPILIFAASWGWAPTRATSSRPSSRR